MTERRDVPADDGTAASGGDVEGDVVGDEADATTAGAADDQSVVRLSVPEMDCPSCADTVERSVRTLDGVADVDPQFATGRLAVAYDPAATDGPAIVDRVEAAGYAVEDEGTAPVTLTAPDVDCPSCADTVERALAGVAGVRDVNAQPATGRIDVALEDGAVGETAGGDGTPDGDGAVDEDALVAAVEGAGYEVTEVATDGDRAGAGAGGARAIWTGPRARKTAVGGALLAVGMVLEFLLATAFPIGSVAGREFVVADALFLLAVAAAGQEIVRGGYYSARMANLDIDLLMTLAIAGALVASIAFGESLYFEAATLAVLFSTAELLEQYSMDRARGSLRELMDLSPEEATVLREGTEGDDREEVTVPVEEVAAGDVVAVRPGEKIPVDGEVRDGTSAVDQSPITGESVPVDKTVGDAVYAGSINEGGYLEVAATAPGTDTTLSRIVELVEDAQSNRTEREQFVDRFAAYYTPVVVAFAVLVTVVPPLAWGASWPTHVVYGLTLLVLACPCAFVISTPVSVVSGITSAARNGVLIKGGDHLEAMGEVEAVALDKTGTLTKGELAVTDVIPLGGNDEADVLRCARGLEARSEHPIGEAIVDEADDVGVEDRTVEAFEAITGKGVRAELDGTTHYAGKPGLFEELGFDLSHVHATTDGGVVTRTARQLCERNNCLDLLEETVPALQAEGKTVVLVGTEEEIEGVVAVADEIRPEAARAVRRLRELGVERTVMLTGDNERTARAIAEAVGVDEYRAELLPDEKVAAVEELAETYDGVAMVGDGVNDAPALATATVGVAMGAAGTDTALETADVALLSDDLSALPYLYELSRDATGVIRQNVWTSLGAKAALALAVPFGYVPIWAAVLIGDAGMTTAVTANAMRLARVRPEE